MYVLSCTCSVKAAYERLRKKLDLVDKSMSGNVRSSVPMADNSWTTETPSEPNNCENLSYTNLKIAPILTAASQFDT